MKLKDLIDKILSGVYVYLYDLEGNILNENFIDLYNIEPYSNHYIENIWITIDGDLGITIYK